MTLFIAIAVIALAFPALGQDLVLRNATVTDGRVVLDRLYPNPYSGR